MRGSSELGKIVELMGHLNSQELGELSQLVKAEIARRFEAMLKQQSREATNDRK